MRKLECVGYYLSCMFFFNLLHTLYIAEVYISSKCYDGDTIYLFIMFGVSLLLTIFGLISTFFIITRDASKENIASTGRNFKILTLKNLNYENYFMNVYILISAGILIHTNPYVLMPLAYLITEIIYGIIYIHEGMYYINPFYILLEYNIYECTGKDAITNRDFSGNYIFIVNGDPLEENETISYMNTSARMIRLNREK